VTPTEKLKALMASIEAGTWKLEEGVRVITNEELDEWESGAHLGRKRGAEHLRPLHPVLRPIAVSEGVIWMNMAGGGTYSQALWFGAREVAAGRCGYIERNQAVIRNDPHGTKSAVAAEAGVSHAAYLRSVGAGG
jgi:hypothetical protein